MRYSALLLFVAIFFSPGLSSAKDNSADSKDNDIQEAAEFIQGYVNHCETPHSNKKGYGMMLSGFTYSNKHKQIMASIDMKSPSNPVTITLTVNLRDLDPNPVYETISTMPTVIFKCASSACVSNNLDVRIMQFTFPDCAAGGKRIANALKDMILLSGGKISKY